MKQQKLNWLNEWSTKDFRVETLNRIRDSINLEFRRKSESLLR